MPPLIKIKLVLNGKVEVLGVYDSGSNVSLINSKLLRTYNNNINLPSPNLKTINGVKQANGIVKLDVKIFNIEKKRNVFVIDKENFDYDFLIGLDCIKSFKLVQDENLEISQKVLTYKNEIFNKNCSTEVLKNKNKSNKRIYLKKEPKECGQSTKNEYIINFNENIKTENFQIQINHVNYSQKVKIDELVEQHKSIFVKDKYDIGIVSDYEAHIDLLEEKYCSKRPYRCTIEARKEIEQQISKLLDRKLIEESYSPFAAPVTLAFKKDENKKSRLCIDFRDSK